MNNKMEVTRSAGFFSPNVNEVRVRQRYGLVYLMAGDKVLEMRTPLAHKTGFDLVKQAGEALPGEFVILRVNGQELNFLSHQAKQIGGSLLRKADDADDFQKRLN